MQAGSELSGGLGRQFLALGLRLGFLGLGSGKALLEPTRKIRKVNPWPIPVVSPGLEHGFARFQKEAFIAFT